jgi:hypothetical protein
MRALLHLLSVALLLPGAILAGAFVMLGNAIAAPSLQDFFGVLLQMAVWLIPWGLLACLVALLVLALGGLSTRLRWLAGVCVTVLAVGSSAVVLALTLVHDNFSPGQLFFLAPAAIAACIGSWLAASERPRGAIAPPAI